METKHRFGVWLVAAGAAAFSLSALAQTPSAGDLLQGLDRKTSAPATGKMPDVDSQIPDAPRKEGGPKVLVNRFKLTGVTVYNEADLQRLIQPFTGRKIDFSEMQAAADAIANHYRKNGYFLAHTYLPGQEIVDGLITIAVLEGRVGEVRVEMDKDAKIRPEVARGYIEKHIKSGDLITTSTIEHGLLLLNDLPGSEVKSTLVPGKKVGLADVVVTVGSGKRATAQVEVDNYGLRSTGEWRHGATVSLNSPLGNGDQLSMRGLGTNEGGLRYSNVAYVTPVGLLGTRMGIGHTQMDYKIGGDFKSLQAHGNATVDNYFVQHPMYRTRNLNAFAQLGYDAKKLKDYQDSVSTMNSRTFGNVVGTVFGDARDNVLGGGMSTWSLSRTWGDLSLSDKTTDQGPNGWKTNGGFDKTNVQISRLQNIVPGIAFYASYTGQWAGKNLDNTEKLSLGGANGVRAYPQGEAMIDQGYLVTGEIRYALGKMNQKVPGQFVLSTFIDSGKGKTYVKPLPTDTQNNVSRTGAGIGLTWGAPDDFQIKGTLAWRIGEEASADKDRTPRANINAIKWF